MILRNRPVSSIMNIAFYITNHGYGHASRNVPIICTLLRKNPEIRVFIKSDKERCEFLRRNFAFYGMDVPFIEQRIEYYYDVSETGLVLKPGTMETDSALMKNEVLADYTKWQYYIERERKFLTDKEINIVVADIVAWALKAAKEVGIPCLLIGNFSWAQMYRQFYGDEFVKPYVECYSCATKAVWYRIHSFELETYCDSNVNVSLGSRRMDRERAEAIKAAHSRPIVFVSLGASADLKDNIDVSHLPYDFITTRGVHFVGDNVYELPLDTVNTPDYIEASEYVIAKGGWSTVAEILLRRKKCALLLRGSNPEDDNTKRELMSCGYCIALDGSELKNIEQLIDRIEELQPGTYEEFTDDNDRICEIILQMLRR